MDARDGGRAATPDTGGLAPPPHAGHPAPLAEGERVLLHDRKGRRYLVTLTAGSAFHFHGGAVAHDELIGSPEGATAQASRGQALVALRPTGAEWTVKAPRGAQVVYPKDQALIVMLGDIVPGASVVEAGAGSGALTLALLRAVGPSGRVVSFERREDHAEVARRNVTQRLGGAPANWGLRVADVAEELFTLRCDRVVLDLLEPGALVPAAREALHPGGLLVAYTPTVPQVMRLREALAGDPIWGMAQTCEALLRTWHVDGLAVRPDHRMVAHTAFLTTARRLAAATSASLPPPRPPR